MIINALATEPRTLMERAIEQRVRVIPASNDVVIARVLGDLLLYVSMRETTIAPTLVMNGYWEFWVTQAIARHVKPGMVCVDVGANVGYFTMLMAALVGPTGHVHAYEPYPSMTTLMHLSAAANGFTERVTAKGRAVSDAEGEVTLFGPVLRKHWLRAGHATIAPSDVEPLAEQEELLKQRVQAVTLDAEFPDGRVDFVKVDVEGGEPGVWKGSRALRDRCNPVLCIEHDGRRIAAMELLAQIRSEGYRVRFVEHTGELVDLPADGGDPARLYMLWLTR